MENNKIRQADFKCGFIIGSHLEDNKCWQSKTNGTLYCLMYQIAILLLVCVFFYLS